MCVGKAVKRAFSSGVREYENWHSLSRVSLTIYQNLKVFVYFIPAILEGMNYRNCHSTIVLLVHKLHIGKNMFVVSK